MKGGSFSSLMSCTRRCPAKEMHTNPKVPPGIWSEKLAVFDVVPQYAHEIKHMGLAFQLNG